MYHVLWIYSPSIPSARLWIQSIQSLLEDLHAELALRVITEVRHGSVHSYFSASSQYRNVTPSSTFASMPQCCWKRWVWQLLFWLSNSDGFCLFFWKERHTTVGMLPQMRWEQLHFLTMYQVSK